MVIVLAAEGQVAAGKEFLENRGKSLTPEASFDILNNCKRHRLTAIFDN